MESDARRPGRAAAWITILAAASAAALIARAAGCLFVPAQYVSRAELEIVAADPARAAREHAGSLADRERWQGLARQSQDGELRAFLDAARPSVEIGRPPAETAGRQLAVLRLSLVSDDAERARESLRLIVDGYLREMQSLRDKAGPDARKADLVRRQTELESRREALLADQKRRLEAMNTSDPDRLVERTSAEMTARRREYEDRQSELQRASAEIADLTKPAPPPSPDAKALAEEYDRDPRLRSDGNILAEARVQYVKTLHSVMSEAAPLIESLRRKVEELGQQVADYQQKGKPEPPVAAALRELGVGQIQLLNALTELQTEWDDRQRQLGERRPQTESRPVADVQSKLDTAVKAFLTLIGQQIEAIDAQVAKLARGRDSGTERYVVASGLGSKLIEIKNAKDDFRRKVIQTTPGGNIRLDNYRNTIARLEEGIALRRQAIRDQLGTELQERHDKQRATQMTRLRRQVEALEKTCAAALEAAFAESDKLAALLGPYRQWQAAAAELAALDRDADELRQQADLAARQAGPHVDQLRSSAEISSEPEPASAARRSTVSWALAGLTFVLTAGAGLLALRLTPRDVGSTERPAESEEQEYNILA